MNFRNLCVAAMVAACFAVSVFVVGDGAAIGVDVAGWSDVAFAMTFMPAARGIRSVRADGPSAVEILAELQKTFESFKQERDEELKGINAKFADVVQTEKVDRINAEITQLTKALDDVNNSLAAIQIGGGGSGDDPAKKEYSDAFAKFFRKGAEAGLRDLEVQAGLTTQSDPDGGFLVPTETEQTIDRVLTTVSAMRQIARVMPIGTDEYKKLVNVGGAGAGWVGEEESRPETDTPTLRELVFNTMELYANPATTQRMLDDGIIDIGGWLGDEVNIAFAEKEGSAYISGNGVKKPRGFLAYPTVANDSYTWGSLGFIASGAAAGFAGTNPADQFIDLVHSLKQGYRQNGSWLMSDLTIAKVRKFKDGDGNYIWRLPESPGEPSTVLSKPLVTDDNMPSVAADTFPIAFGDFQRGYLIVDRTGIRILRDPYSNKPYVHFYTTKRVGGGVSNFEAIKLMKIST